jgi:hypothetical protein
MSNVNLNYSLPVISAGYTKTQLKIAAEHVINDIIENGNAIPAAEALSAMEAFVKEVKSSKQYIDFVREEIQKHGKVANTASGTKLELSEVGTKYDFTNCEDGILKKLEALIFDLDCKLTERKDFLKKLPLSGLLITDEDTGETYKVYPPSKTSTSSYKVTIAK